KPHWVWHVENDPLSRVGQQGEKRFRSSAGGDWNVLAQAQDVELVDPCVVDHFAADIFYGALELRSGRPIQRPPLRAVLTGRRRTVENLAFPPIETRQMTTTGESRPDNAIAVDVDAARYIPVHRRTRILERRLVDFGERRCRRIGTWTQAHDGT